MKNNCMNCDHIIGQNAYQYLKQNCNSDSQSNEREDCPSMLTFF